MPKVKGYDGAYYSMTWLGPKGYPEDANAGRCYFTGTLGMLRFFGEEDVLFADGTGGDGFSFRWCPKWGAPAFNGGKGTFHEIWEYTPKALGFEGHWEQDDEDGWDGAWAKLRGLVDRGIPVQVGLHYSLLLPYGAEGGSRPSRDFPARRFRGGAVADGDAARRRAARGRRADAAQPALEGRAWVARAEAEYFAEREKNRDIDEFRRQHRSDFRTHLVVYGIINTFLLCINLLTSADHLWFLYPLLGWGIGIAIHGYTTYNENSNEWRQEFEEWKRKRNWAPMSVTAGEDVRLVLERELVIARDSGRDISKIDLIKQVREGTGLGLKDSKDAVEAYLRQNPGAPVE